jgi:hypothetical protein
MLLLLLLLQCTPFGLQAQIAHGLPDVIDFLFLASFVYLAYTFHGHQVLLEGTSAIVLLIDQALMASLFCGLAGYHHPIMQYISRLGKRRRWFRTMEDVLKFKAMFYQDVDVNFNC